MPAERRREILFQCGGAVRTYRCQWGATLAFANPKFCFTSSRAASARNHALDSANTHAREHEDISQQQADGPQVLKEEDEAGERSYGQIIVQRTSIGAGAELNCFNLPSMPRISFMIKARLLLSYRTSYPRMRDSILFANEVCHQVNRIDPTMLRST